MKRPNLFFAAFLAIALSVDAATGPSSADDTNGADSAQSSTAKSVEPKSRADKALPNGFYLIQRESPEKTKVEPIDSKEQIALYDYEFFDPADRGTVTYVVLNKDKFIPISLSDAPAKEPDGRGRRKLMLQLAKDQIAPLEEFTTSNCGKSVAIVIGGKVVTTHKIREPIKGGKIQITRCSDNGCDVLYTQLQGQ